MSYLNNRGVWGKPIRLPDNINTPYAEESVLIHPDGKTLYFASKGHIGLGGTDLFMTRLQSDGKWSNPVNLGYPINTKYNENYSRKSIRHNLPFHKLSKDELQKCFNMSAPQFFRSMMYRKLRKLELEIR